MAEANDELQLTPEELQARIDSEADKRTSKALETAKTKWEAEQAKALEDAKAEGQRLAKMTSDEKQDEEMKQRIANIEKREKELNVRELKSATVSMLNDNGLPANLADSLVALGDADKIKSAADTLKKSLDETVNQRVNESLRDDPPANTSSNLDTESDPFKQIMSKYDK